MTNPAEPDIARLRGEIDALDAQLITLLAERRRLVGEVAEVKKRHHLPVYHPSREEDLISARRGQAKAMGLSPDFVEEVFRRMLRESRVHQTGEMAGHAVRPGATVLVVGGRGAMGKSLCRWFDTAGYDVRVLEREDWLRVDELARGADLAVLSVPIDLTAEAAAKLGPHLGAETVFVDITSVKTEPVRAMLAAHAGPVLGLHPMFGPTTTTMDRQIVVATEGRDPERCQWVLDQLAAWGSVVLPSTPEEHDDMMAVVQALRHFSTFAFGQFMARRRVDLGRTLDFSSPIYRLELGMVGRLFAQDSGLYAEIIFATPERRALLRQYVESVQSNLDLIDTADRDAFHREFREVAEWFGPFSDQAIRESTYLIEKLVERF